MLPLLVYRRLDGGGKEVDSAHPLYRLLHDQPNPWQTAMQFRQQMQASFDMRGNALAQQVFNGAGRLDMLVPLDGSPTSLLALDHARALAHLSGATVILLHVVEPLL